MTAFDTQSLDPEKELAALLRGDYPDTRGRYGPFGGRFVPETLMGALERLESVFAEAMRDDAFLCELDAQLAHWVGRPTPLCHAPRLSEAWGADVWLKREDLAHTGAHKINNAIGQALLAMRLGVKRIVAETGAGQHGVATAAACARVGLPCRIYMGAVDVARQAPNVERMARLGAELIPVESGDRTLRAAIDEALRDWVSDPDGTHYLLGSAVGPHPFPLIVRTLQSTIGREARAQMLGQGRSALRADAHALGSSLRTSPHRLPDAIFVCVGGGSNAIGMLHPFIGDREVALFGIEAGGTGSEIGQHSSTISRGRPGVLHGSFSLLLQDDDGQIIETHSISAGLDYPGVGPEHALLHAIGRVRYESASDTEALAAFDQCATLEGIIPALEPSHALAAAQRWAKQNPGATILIGLSGRGDKDMGIVIKHGKHT